MKIVKDNINILELKEMAKKMQYGLVKAMIDVEKEIMSVDGALHADLMEFLSVLRIQNQKICGVLIFFQIILVIVLLNLIQ